MNYKQTIDYLYSSVPMFHKVGSSAYKEGMENSFLIDEHLGRPHTKYKTIHVGGTNGKGSTSHLLASVLQEAGYKVGLYTSPHLIDFRERIKVNGKMVSEEFVIDFVAKHKTFFESIQPSFFELTTGMAFDYFATQQVDIAIIEVGLGGRLDCTNVITPILSIITNISFDHTNLLGNTLEAIAKEKAGIIKPGVPAIIGERESFNIDVDAIFVEDNNPIRESKLLPSSYWEFETDEYPELIDQLGGFAQEKNAATVLTAIKVLKKQLNIPQKAVYRGFRYVIDNTGLMGRWQIIQYDPKIIFDTAHNEAGINYIVKQLEREQYNKLHIVIGMVNDKDSDSVLKQFPEDAIYYFTEPSIPRAKSAEELKNEASKYNLEGDSYTTVKEAFDAAKRDATKKDIIFVGGSTFVVADALSTL
ncbi:dihydrofolate synthase/folylpolyglutamate synthase [Dysgonomonadaceae bacterium PH5-43]|nr:dihydrofolate synthase/folylpolyglutamate synthase [Dysgonomonadaceae bacterium PH5-43]